MVIKIRYKKTLLVIAILITLITIFSIANKSIGMQHYQTVDFSTGLVTASALNVRQGPSTSYKVITQVYKNEYIRVFARIGNWYVIQTDKDIIGAVSVDYVRAIYPSNNSNNNTSNNDNVSLNTELTADEKEVFNLINEKRKAART